MQMDAYIGGLAEDPPADQTMGELFAASWVDQFRRIRDGDRFYFENTANGLFSADEVSAIHETSEDGRRYVMHPHTSSACSIERYHLEKHRYLCAA